MTDWLFARVPDALAGVALLVISVITFLWGFVLIVAAYAAAGRPDLPRWHPRRWVAPGFDWWLGWFLVLSDAGIYAILGFGVLRTDEDIEVWAFAYVLACATTALLAFKHWARDRTSGGER